MAEEQRAGKAVEREEGKTGQRFSQGNHHITLPVHTSVWGAKCPVKKNCPICFVFVFVWYF